MAKKEEESGKTVLEGFAELAKALGPFGVPFSLVFMANVVVIFTIWFLSSQFEYLWVVVIGFAVIEVFIGSWLYKEKQRVPPKLESGSL